MLHKMKNLKNWPAFALAIVALFIVATTNVTATRHDVLGLVFIDDNLNGVWDVGEAGYDGEWQWVEDEGAARYVGATVTIITPAYDEFEVETNPLREAKEGEEIICTQQDLVLNDDEINPNPVRPCSGTWGLPLSADETFLEIRIAVEGYMVTSPNPQYYLTGTDTDCVDFGIAPLTDSAKSIGGPVVDVEETETAVVTPATYSTVVEVTGFVPGLVFIDDNEDGIWQLSEAGYGGEWQWVEDEEMSRYVGATITLISPAYDEFEVETMPYRELEENEEVACTQQDLLLEDGELNPNPVRPCSGAWGLSHAGDDVRWEVWLTAPDGYRLTSANPQYYVTGSGQMPLDFGITPISVED
jgi:hypothetical protein